MALTTPPRTRKVRIKDLEPGMKVERLDADLNFIYLPVTSVEPKKRDGRTVSYLVYVEGFDPDVPEREQDSSVRPFYVRTSGAMSVLSVLNEG
jgi:hypothetical protein